MTRQLNEIHISFGPEQLEQGGNEIRLSFSCLSTRNITKCHGQGYGREICVAFHFFFMLSKGKKPKLSRPRKYVHSLVSLRLEKWKNVPENCQQLRKHTETLGITIK